jgi:hypothetical protein
MAMTRVTDCCDETQYSLPGRLPLRSPVNQPRLHSTAQSSEGTAKCAMLNPRTMQAVLDPQVRYQ